MFGSFNILKHPCVLARRLLAYEIGHMDADAMLGALPGQILYIAEEAQLLGCFSGQHGQCDSFGKGLLGFSRQIDGEAAAGFALGETDIA